MGCKARSSNVSNMDAIIFFQFLAYITVSDSDNIVHGGKFAVNCGIHIFHISLEDLVVLPWQNVTKHYL